MPKHKLSQTIAAFAVATLLVSSAIPAAPVRASETSGVFDVIVGFKDSLPNTQSVYSNFEVVEHSLIFGAYYRFSLVGESAAEVKAKLAAMPEIASVESEKTVRVAAIVNDEFFTRDYEDVDKQWYLPMVKADKAWDLQPSAGSIIVAVVDTGIDAMHQDLRDGRVIGGYKTYCLEVTNGVCTDRTEGTILEGNNSDDNSHGTSVASIIGASTNNLVGVAGAARDVRLMPVKVLNKDGVGTSSDVAEGIVWAAENGAKVINLSLGGASLIGSSVMDAAMEIAREYGAIVVAAAGNDQSVGVDLDSKPSNPVCSNGSNNNVIGVAALTALNEKAVFSNFGRNCIDISAPGVRMLTAYYDPAKPDQHNVYAYRTGTSFAAPLVSAAVAMVRAAKPSLSVDSVKEIIFDTADSVEAENATTCNNQACGDKLGAGRLNIYAAVELALNSNIVTPPVVNPPAVPAPAEGTLIRGNQSLTVYLMQGGQRRPLTYLAFVSNGFNFNNVVVQDEAYVNKLPLGELYPPKYESLIRASNSLTVYVVVNNTKHPLTYTSFASHGFSFANVVVMDPAQVSAIAEGGVYQPKDGTLMRASNNLTVFVFEAGSLHALNYQAFTARNFSFSNVKVVDPSEINLYPRGQDYLN